MKKLACLVVFALSAGPLLAARPTADLPVETAGPPAVLSEVVKSRTGIQPLGVVPDNFGFNNEIYVAVVINSPGLGGTFFTTDFILTNGRQASQEFLVFFLAAGVSNASVLGQRFTAAANTTYSLDNYLGSGSGQLNKSGVGTLLIFCVLAGTNTVDSGGLFHGLARIATNQPTCPGTTSFTEPALRMTAIQGDRQVLSVGARQNANFRTNFLLVNFDLNRSRSFVAIFITPGGSTQQTVTIPAFGMAEVAVPSTISVAGNGYFFIVFFPVDSDSFIWFGGLVVADNSSGDGYFSSGKLLPAAEY